MDLRPHIGKGIWALFDKSFAGIYGFALLVFVVGGLERSQYGIYTIAFALTSISLLFNKGFILYPMTKYEAEDISRPLMLGNTFLFSLCSMLFLGLLWFLAAPLLAVIFDAPDLAVLLRLMPLGLMGFFFRDFSLSYLQAHRRISAMTLLDGIYFIGAALSFVVLNLSGRLHSAYDIVWIHIVFGWVSSIVALFPVLRTIKMELRFSWEELTKIFHFGKYSLSMGIGEIFFYQFDLLLLGVFCSPATVAVYNAAKLLFRMYSLLSQSLNLLIFPGTSLLHAQKRLTEIKSMYEKIIAYYWSIMLGLNTVLFIAAGIVIEKLYSGNYPDSVLLFRLFLVFSFFEPLYNISMNVLYGIGKPNKAFKPLLISVPAFLALNAVLIPLLQGLGATLAFGIANIIIAISYGKTLKAELGISLSGIKHYMLKIPSLLWMTIMKSPKIISNCLKMGKD